MTESQAPARPAGPRLEFTHDRHDFGPSTDVGSLRHAFEFVNAGDQRLVIGEITTSCGCTAASLERQVYEPGEGAALEVDWQTKGVGRQTQSVMVRSNSVGGPVTILYVDAEIEPLVRVEPMNVSFGRVRLGERHTQRAQLICADPDLRVESVTSSNPHFSGQVVEGAGGLRELEVSLHQSAPWGQNFGSLRLAVVARVTPETEPVQHRFDVPVHALLFGEVETEPGMFAVGRVDPGGSFEYVVKVVRSGPEPFELLDAHVEHAVPPTMSVRSEPLPAAEGNGYLLELEGRVGEHLGPISGQVRFTTDVPGEEERSLKVMGLVRPLDANGR